jgi:cob(I)alamin adenosyltransferase
VKIYTKTGDDGTTGLFGGARVAKDDPRVEAYGSVDEVNAVVGLARAAGLPEPVDQLASRLQEDRFVIGAELATVTGRHDRLKIPLIDPTDVARLEAAIDRFEAQLGPLTSFILPGGTAGAAALHQARTVCRRAERYVVAASRSSEVRDTITVYLNRLSDLLFVLARFANHEAGIADVPWSPRSAPPGQAGGKGPAGDV